MWPSRSSKSTMPPPDKSLHPEGLSIPITQTITPSSHRLTLPQVTQPLQSHLQTPIWTTLSHVKPSPLMTPPLSISWMPISPLTLSTKPTSTMCLDSLPPIMGLLLIWGQRWPCWLRCENFGKDWQNCHCHWHWQP